MYAPGRGFLKVTGILYIVFSGIGIVFTLLAMAGTAALGTLLGINTSILTLIYLVALVLAAYGLFMGIIGVKHCANLEKAKFLRTCVIIEFVLRGIVVISSAVMIGFSGVVLESIGFVLPILFLIGASKNIEASNAPPTQPM